MKKLILLLPLVFLLGIIFVSAIDDCNLTAPNSTNNVIRSGFMFNVTHNQTGDGTENNITVVIQAKSASTLNTSYSVVINETNATNLRHLNVSLQGKFVLGDSNDYVFRALCFWNGTGEGSKTSAEVSGVTLDRSKPQVATSITFTNPVKDTQTITATIDRNTTNKCFIKFGGHTVERRAMTLSGTTCTYTVGKNNPPNSDYDTYINTDDNTNTTDSGIQYVSIKAVSSDGGGLFGGSTFVTEGGDSSGQSVFGGGTSSNPFLPNQGFKLDDKTGALLIIGLLVFLYIKNKK